MSNTYFSIKGQVVDVFKREIISSEIFVKNGLIEKIIEIENAPKQIILPGLIDSHVHIESSMLTPSHFAEMVVPRGTIAVVTDPHEIANVMGMYGVQYMIEDSKKVPMKFFFGAPSCVPATSFETSGAVLDSKMVSELLENPDIYFLSEVMNYPGVIFQDEEVMKKIESALKLNKKIDGHAPNLSDKDLQLYINSGISTDHECSSHNEALEKMYLGMKIQIREGSSARNFENLQTLFRIFPDKIMLCTDDSHPDDIENSGHIDKIIRQGLRLGIDIFDLLRSASVIPVQHYNLPVGLLRVGDPADFIIIDDFNKFKVSKSYINGNLVYDSKQGICFPLPQVKFINKFRTSFVSLSEIETKVPDDKKTVKVIEVEDGELLTNIHLWTPSLNNNRIVKSDITEDILKIVVVNRYENVPPAIGFIKNIGLKSGAIASSVAHDSHNIISVGVDDKSIFRAINLLIENKGGICALNDEKTQFLKLPIAGIISNENGKVVSKQYQNLNKFSRYLGTTLKAPFMTLSFMSLLVIPHLKLSDKGLFDGDNFRFTDLFV